MKKIITKVTFFILCFAITFSMASCNLIKKPEPAATLIIIPSRTALSPALIKKPLVFTGSGYEPKEIVLIDLILPENVKIKGINVGENVGLAFGSADETGNFKLAMKPTATLNWFFQVGWKNNLSPDFKSAKPIPPGNYNIIASGLNSNATAKAILTIIAPPKKK